MQSRRASPRIPYDEAVCLTRVDGNGRLYGRGIDLGTGGVSLVCAEACPLDTEVRCDLLLPGGPRPVPGRVVRVTVAPAGFELAVMFEDLKPGVTGVIEDLIAAHAADVLPLPPADRDEDVGAGDQDALAATGTIRSIAVDPSSGDGVPRLALDVDPPGAPRSQTQRYGALRLAPPITDVVIPPTNLPPPCGHPLPSVVVEPAIALENESNTPTPVAMPARAAAPPPAPPPRRARANRGTAVVMRGTAVVARRPDPNAWDWRRPAVVVVAPAVLPAVVPAPPRRPSLLDAPLSGRALIVVAPLVVLAVALLVQLSR